MLLNAENSTSPGATRKAYTDQYGVCFGIGYNTLVLLTCKSSDDIEVKNLLFHKNIPQVFPLYAHFKIYLHDYALPFLLIRTTTLL
jgi:hypothetical protein